METPTQSTNDVLQSSHPNIIKKDNKLSITPCANLTLGNIDNHYPINYPAILEALLPFLELHDILKLLMVSKCIQLTFLNNFKDTGIISENTIVNAMEHNCSRCVERMTNNADEIDLNVFMVGCKHNSLEGIEMLSNLYATRFLGGPITYNIQNSNTCFAYYTYFMDPDHNTEFNNFVHNCVVLSFNHTPVKTIKLLEHITKYFKITNLKTLTMICELQNKNIITNIVKHIEYYDVDINIVKFLLPYLCEYDINDGAEYCISILHCDDDYDYVMDLIKNNVNTYKSEIMLLLLKKIIYDCEDFGDDNEFIIKSVNQYSDKQLLKETLKNTIIDDNLKMTLVTKAYELNLSEYLPFLKDTKELNIMSINEITKNETNVAYTNQFSSEELLNLIVNTNNIKIKTQLILSINDTYDILKHDDSMKIIIDFVINNYNDILLKHVANLINIDIKFKIMLVPLVYKNATNVSTIFLDDTEELNMLSLNEAIKYNDQRVYASKLSFDTILKFIVNTSSNVRESLLAQLNINTDELKKYDTNIIINISNFCTITKNILPKHYKYLDDVYNYEDNEVYYNCKFKMSKKVVNLNYTKLLLEMDESCYHEIFDMMMILLDTGKHYFLKHGTKTIKHLVEHPKFNDVSISNVIKLLKYYYDNNKLLNSIITKRYFFRQFDNK